MLKKNVPAKKSTPAKGATTAKATPAAPAKTTAPVAKTPPVQKSAPAKTTAPVKTTPKTTTPVAKTQPEQKTTHTGVMRGNAKTGEPAKTVEVPVVKMELKKEPVQTVPQVKEPTAILLEIGKHSKEIEACQADILSFRQQIELKEARIAEHYREMQILEKIQRMTKLIEQPYIWHSCKRPASTYKKTAWSEEHTYRTATLDLMVTLSESTIPNKKLKFIVEVTGRRVLPSISSEIGDVDYNYVLNKYMIGEWNPAITRTEWLPNPKMGNVEVTKGYETKKEALKALETWQERLVSDHEEMIHYEEALFKACK